MMKKKKIDTKKPRSVSKSKKQQSQDETQASSLSYSSAMTIATNFFNSTKMTAHDKLQKITTSFNVQMVKVNKEMNIDCWLCRKKLFQRFRKESKVENKKQLMEILMIHLISSHTSEVYQNYMQKVLKFRAEEISIQTFFSHITETDYEQIIIIDRQNTGNFEKPLKIYSYVVEVISKANKNLAKNRFISANSNKKDAADCLIIILAWEALNKTHTEVIVLTNDHFGEVLKQIVGNHFGERLNCLKKQQFENLQ